MNSSETSPPVVLTIAGFDPSGGAGIIADLRAISFFGCVPVAAVTSLTFQSSTSMSGAAHQRGETVRDQVTAVVGEFPIRGVKTGMLPTREIVREVVRLCRDSNLPAPVVDPVMRSSSGYDLIDADAWELLLRDLMPLARVITPNIPEATRMTGLEITDEDGMRRGAARIRELGARAVLIKGGREEQRSGVRDQRSGPDGSPSVREGSAQAIDVLDDEGEITVFRGDWIEGPPMRGTGCTLSAAIAACLAKGMNLKESVATAKGFVADRIMQKAHF